NNYLYNDKELFDDGGLNWYDYGFRNYDPQIGRFLQSDPLADDFPFLTQYQYASGDPIANIDIDGLEAAAVTVFSDGVKTAGDGLHKVLEEVVVVGHRVAKASPTALSVTGSFLKGIGQSLWGTLVGIGNAVAHPINTVTAIVHAVAHPIQTARAIGTVVTETYKAFKNGDANTRANILGKVTGEIGQLLIGVGAAKGAQEVIEVSKVVQEGEKVIEAAKVVQEGEEVVNTVQKATQVVQKGRLGKAATRKQIVEIADELESRGYKITGGGGRVGADGTKLAEEYLKPIGGGRKGGSYLDITATKNGKTIRINTVDTYKSGKITSRELKNAARIRAQTPGKHLILIKK
ncbi:MAG TPA: RHS repeat-associated core domain-containing protein, partial [Puia sp.]|nr:RHS repeat-associated core domain-containing protein [Puia sp.]